MEEYAYSLYWVCDTAVKTVTIVANQTATVTFANTHNGRGKVIKVMPDGGDVSGWKFEVSFSDGKLLGTYTTGEDGTILTDYLLPGSYTIKEIIPEGSPYICDLPNPKTVTIQAGQTAEVTFTNRLKPGEISIQKVDTLGRPLAGAEFLLEWSADGSMWAPVAFTDSLDVKEGTCTSEGLKDGKFTSDEDGIVLCTLVTCTPTGVNTHRLLVRGTRIPYEEAVAAEEEIAAQEDEPSSHWENQYWLGIRLGLVAMICVVLLVNIILMVKKRKQAGDSRATIAERKSKPRKKKGGRYVRK